MSSRIVVGTMVIKDKRQTRKNKIEVVKIMARELLPYIRWDKIEEGKTTYLKGSVMVSELPRLSEVPVITLSEYKKDQGWKP